MADRRVSVSVSLSREALETLDVLKEKFDTTRSEVVEMAVQALLRDGADAYFRSDDSGDWGSGLS